jgi:hypothetical protein
LICNHSLPLFATLHCLLIALAKTLFQTSF